MIRKVTKEQVESDPYFYWNQFIDLMVSEEFSNLTEYQKDMFIVFTFDSEVQNGGIVQYFTNQGAEHFERLLEILDRLEAYEQSKILKKILNLRELLGVSNVNDNIEFIEEALVGYDYKFENEKLENDFESIIEECEDKFSRIEPELTRIIESEVDANRDKFFSVV